MGGFFSKQIYVYCLSDLKPDVLWHNYSHKEVIMVDSINDSIYSQNLMGAYSIGSYSQLNKTDTEVFEDSFQDVLDSVGDKTQENSVQKIDESSLGVPLGMEIDGIQDVEEVAQGDTSQSGGSGSSSQEDDEEYDEMDLNQDGTVSPAEMIIYEMTHGTTKDDNSQVSSADSSLISEAISAYMAA